MIENQNNEKQWGESYGDEELNKFVQIDNDPSEEGPFSQSTFRDDQKEKPSSAEKGEVPSHIAQDQGTESDDNYSDEVFEEGK